MSDLSVWLREMQDGMTKMFDERGLWLFSYINLRCMELAADKIEMELLDRLKPQIRDQLNEID